MALLPYLVLSCILAVSAADSHVKVEVDTSNVIAKVAPEFVSFNFDSSQWRSLNLEDKTLALLAGSLSPAHLRVGGTQGDFDVYAVGAASNMTCDAIPKPMTDYRCKLVTEQNWGQLLDFVEKTKLSLVFGLNDMYGKPTKVKKEMPLCNPDCPAGNPSNREALLRWTQKNRPKAQIYGFELGNELNTCLNGAAGATSQAKDFAALATLRDELWPKGAAQPKLIGPDAHSFTEFNPDGLEWWGSFVAAAKDTVDAFTFHMYSMGNGATLDANNLGASFLNPEALDKSRVGALALKKVNGEKGAKGPLWGGETSSANNGGKAGITDTYINGFWYLDQLGSHAQVGVEVFQRQTLVSHGGYPMVDASPTLSGILTPRPDYWIALLHKRIMGQQVLNVSSSSPTLRTYAHCGVNGGVALAILNIGAKDVTIDFGSIASSPTAPREEWVLTAGAKLPDAPNPLQSFDAKLNGVLIKMKAGPALPDLPGKKSSGPTMQVPATSYAFVSFPKATAAACSGGITIV